MGAFHLPHFRHRAPHAERLKKGNIEKKTGLGLINRANNSVVPFHILSSKCSSLRCMQNCIKPAEQNDICPMKH